MTPASLHTHTGLKQLSEGTPGVGESRLPAVGEGATDKQREEAGKVSGLMDQSWKHQY